MKDNTSNISFWVFDAQKMDSALVYKNLDSIRFKNILLELNAAIKDIPIKSLMHTPYLLYANQVCLPVLEQSPNSLVFRLKRLKKYIKTAEIELLHFNSINEIMQKTYLIGIYQSLKASAVFNDVWFINPRIHFSNQFIAEYLPSQNNFIKHNPLYPNCRLPKIDCEKELFGQEIIYEKHGFNVFKMTHEIAIKILENNKINKDEQYYAEINMFYEIIKHIVDKKYICLIFEYDNLYIHDSEPI